jgi:hypothetical protein
MAILNITYNGRSADVRWQVDDASTDADVKRAAAEALRGDDLGAMRVNGITPAAFDHFVVDRLPGPGGELRIYLRPKVPFGC